MHRRTGRAAVLICFVALAGLATASSAGAATFSNATAITIPAEGQGSSYPSTVNVTGMSGTITDVNVTLSDYSHESPDDVGVVLVAPTGAAIELMNGAGTSADVANVSLIFDDAASTQMGNSTDPVSGSFKPTAHYTGDVFPAPGPVAYGNPGPIGSGTATLASIFNGLAPNGNWNLFVVDFEPGEGGSIAGGWSLTVATSPPAAPSLSGVTPASGADDNRPKLLGSAEGPVLKVFATPDCSGSSIVTTTPAALGAGILLQVADNTTTQFSASAENTTGPSACSTPISYTESTPAGPPPGTTVTNATAVTISAVGATNGAPYPSPIVVSGLPPAITDLDVKLNGFSHTLPDDVGVLLVGPTGAAFKVMDGVGEEGDAVNADLTFDDSASQFMDGSQTPVTGSYKPSAFYAASGASFPAPAPLAAYAFPGPIGGGSATLASVFNGLNPNGTWNLFVRDFANGSGGSIGGGWSLTIQTLPAPPALTSTAPASPANDNSPKLLGSAEAGATVDVYASADCSGAPVATGSAAQLASPGLTVSVADNSTTQFTAIATNGSGPSPCSAPISYTESTPSGSGTGTGSGTGGGGSSPAPPVETKLDKSKITAARGKAKFSFSGSGGSGALSFECRLDKKPFRACASPQKYSGLKAGRHSFQVRAKDSKGTVDPSPATRKFSIPKPK